MSVFCLFFKLILDGTEALMLSTCGQTDKHLPKYSNQNQVPFRATFGTEDKCTQTHELKILPALLS